MLIKILALPIGDIYRASSRLRVYNVLDKLDQNKFSNKILPYYINTSNCRFFHIIFSRIRLFFYYFPFLLLYFRKYDIIFIQETLLPSVLLRLFKKKKIIYDFSDPVNLNSNKLFYKSNNIKFNNIIRLSDYILLENSNYINILNLNKARYYIIRGPIELNSFKINLSKENISDYTTIGWTGSPGTFKYIEPLLPIIDKLGLKYKIILNLIGNNKYVYLENVKINNIKWQLETEYQEVSKFDIGIFYLEDNNYNSLRGGGKIFVYMAAGIPIIASNVGIAKQVIDLDSEYGYLIDNSKEEWYKHLEILITNKVLRNKMSICARNEILNKYSLQSYLKLYNKIFSL